MRALVKTTAGPGLELRDVPEPDTGPGEVKIRVLRAGLCGTDLHLEQWDDWAASTVVPPMTIGHEFYGEVVEVGQDVDSVRVGQRASGEGHIVCGTCRNCRAGRRHMCIHTKGIGVNRDGAFADYVVLPESNVWVQPDDLDPDLGAVFDPLGNATHTALSFPMAGEDVVITGAGPIGIMAAAVARKCGARTVVLTDVNEYRLALADKVTDVRTVNVAKEDLRDVMKELGIQVGFDVAMEMSGAPSAFNQCVDTLIMGGGLALLGIPSRPMEIDWGKIILKALTIKGVYGREMFDTWRKMLGLLKAGLDLTPLITHRLPYAEFEKGFEAMKSGQSGKVVLSWDNGRAAA